MLPADELGAISDELALWMPDAVTIQRPSTGRDAQGGETRTLTTVHTTVGSLSSPTRAPWLRTIADRVAPRVLQVITMPAGTDVQPNDRLLITGLTFEVIDVLRSSYELARRAAVVEVV